MHNPETRGVANVQDLQDNFLQDSCTENVPFLSSHLQDL